jgi:hypothetical protein
MLIDMNLIGAYIVTLMILALIKVRPDLSKAEQFLCRYGLARFVLAAWLSAVTASYGAGLLSQYRGVAWSAHFIAGMNLWIHEAGHFYFIWAGTFLHVLGGTLTQLLFTLGPALFCCVRRYWACAGVFLCWGGLNCFGIARYVADARAKVLPLFGAVDSSRHDWNNILGMLGLLEYDQMIGGAVNLFGWALVISGGVLLVSATYLHSKGLDQSPR